MRVGIVGWRGMVGSVLMQRMLEERDFDHIEPTFFSTSAAGGKGPDHRPRHRSAEGRERRRARSTAQDMIITCQGGDWTSAMYPKLREAGWSGYFIDAAKTLRMKDDAVIILDPVNRAGDRRGARQGHPQLHRRQLHGQPDDDGARRLVRARSRRVDDVHDLPGGVGRRRAEHARAPAADGRGASCGQEPARGSALGDPRHRPRGRGHPARRSLPDRALRRAAGGLAHPLDRQGHGQRHEPRGVEGRRRDQQDPRPRARPAPSRWSRYACASGRCAATARR